MIGESARAWPPLAETKDADRPMTMKERMEEHRRNPVCANCHRLMDPIGLALETFDGIGAARVRDQGVKIDAATELADGTAVNGSVELRQALLRRPETLVRTNDYRGRAAVTLKILSDEGSPRFII